MLTPMRLGSGMVAFVAVSSAFAQPVKIGVVAFGADAASEREGLLAQKVLLRLAAENSNLADVSATVLGDDPAVREDKAKQAAALLASANDAMDSLEFPAALEKLDAALALLQDADLRAHFADLSNGLALRAVAIHLKDKASKTQSDEALAKLFAVSPDYRFPDGRWAPDVQAWIQAGRQTARQLSTVPLEVGGGSPAFVYVDGVYQGIGPLQVANVPPGQHYLTVAGLGAALWQQSFSTEAGRRVEYELTYPAGGKDLSAQLEHLKGASTAEGVVEPGKALCALGGFKQVLVLGLTQDNGASSLQVYRADRSGRVLRKSLPVAGHGEAALETAEKRALASLPEPLVAPGGAAGMAVAAGEDTSGRRTWSYVAMGGSAAAFIVGIALGASAQSQVNNAKSNLINQPSAYVSAINNARTAAAGADVCYGVALVAAGVGGWLFYTSLTPGTATPEKPAESEEHMSGGVAPLPGGAMVSLSGRF
jgi:hypothetical protein